MNPSFIGLDEAMALHGRAIADFGGSHGLRDVGLLQSALAMPEASFAGEWLHPTLHEMAAAYLFHICKNHPFIDGNKRAALAVALAFLALNDLRLEAPAKALGDMVLGVADGSISKAEASVFFEKYAHPVSR